MKTNRYIKIVAGVCLATALTSLTACGDDFLREEKTNAYSTKYFETEEGILALATSLYENIRWEASNEWCYAPTLYGTDEWTSANDLSNTPWNFYDARFSAMTSSSTVPNCVPIGALWDEMYNGISKCNTLIASADKIVNEDIRNKSLGEAYFLRGYNYYRLYAQYGAVVLQTEPVVGIVRNFNRATEEATLQQAIDDLTNAYNLLPTDRWRGTGTWIKYTAALYLAKAKLFRASERHNVSNVPEERSNWNEQYKAKDLEDVLLLCNEIIQHCPLADNYSQLFSDWNGIDCEAEKNPEILLSAQFNDNSATQSRAFGIYRYFSCNYQTISGQWCYRAQWVGGDPYQRLAPTEYNYSTYDNVNDSRLWKSFQTIYGVVQAKNGANIEKAALGNERTTYGDYGLVFLLNTKTDQRNLQDQYGKFGMPASSTFVHPETGKWVPGIYPLYQDGKYVLRTYSSVYKEVYDGFGRSDVFCPLNKYHEGMRTGPKKNAYRDVVFGRSAEAYLIKAEVLVRQGKPTDAIDVINILRERAQWKTGEDREYYTDGAASFPNNTTKDATTKLDGENITNLLSWQRSFIQKNTYYLSTGISRTTASSDLKIKGLTLPEEDQAIISKLPDDGYNGMLHFIMNERTRELNGEFNRWEELSRTKLLVPRAKAFNEEASIYIKDHHILRPIPQTFIESLLNEDGTNLSKQQQDAWQNNGY